MELLTGEIEPGGVVVGEHLLSFDKDTGAVVGLVGSRCVSCGEHYFPVVQGCTRCCSENMEPCDLGTEGVLWSWTVQSFLPKAPYSSGENSDSFKPYGVGYVEMACGVKVEARLTRSDEDALAIGMPMKLCVVKYGENVEAKAKYTYAFAPKEAV